MKLYSIHTRNMHKYFISWKKLLKYIEKMSLAGLFPELAIIFDGEDYHEVR